MFVVYEIYGCLSHALLMNNIDESNFLARNLISIFFKIFLVHFFLSEVIAYHEICVAFGKVYCCA